MCRYADVQMCRFDDSHFYLVDEIIFPNIFMIDCISSIISFQMDSFLNADITSTNILFPPLLYKQLCICA